MRLFPFNMQANLFSEQLLLTLWVGSLWAIGYLAVPMAFASLGDVTLAGNYAGKLFSAVNILGLACGSVLLISKFIVYGKQVIHFWRFWVIVLMVILTLVFSVYLQPEIAEVKQLMMYDGTLIERFDTLHTISRNLYLVVSLLGMALIVSSDKAKT